MFGRRRPNIGTLGGYFNFLSHSPREADDGSLKSRNGIIARRFGLLRITASDR